MHPDRPDIIVIHEHPEWPKPLLEALGRRGLRAGAFDLSSASIGDADQPSARLFLSQTSASAYLRDNQRAVPFALEFVEALEAAGARVVNGSRALRLELSKFAQIQLMRRLGVTCPRTVLFNDIESLRRRRGELVFPAVLKPNQGGTGARMRRIESFEELEAHLRQRPDVWLPDHLLLVQEYLPHDAEERGIVRMEFLGDELLYAMRVVSHGQFNLCPSEVCHPAADVATDALGDATTALGEGRPDSRSPEFHPFPGVPADAVAIGRRLVAAGGLDLGAIEYLETTDGRRVFYDINANSNLRPSIARAFGFDPFDRVAEFLERELRGSPAPPDADLA